jgi:hypothetical protein
VAVSRRVVQAKPASPATPVQTALAPASVVPPHAAPTLLPAEFIADRIFVHPVRVDGRTLSFYTDSGGGTQYMYADSAKRLGLATRVCLRRQVANQTVRS